MNDNVNDVNKNETNKKSSSLIIIAIVAILIVVILIVVFFVNKNNSDKDNNNLNNNTENANNSDIVEEEVDDRIAHPENYVDLKKDLVGTWYLYENNKKDSSTYYLFNEDGTGKYVGDGDVKNFSYDVMGSSLFITHGDLENIESYEIEFNNNMLTLNDSTKKISFTK